MALEFQPYPRQQKPRDFSDVTDPFIQLGHAFNQYRQQSQLKSHQDALLALQKAQNDREAQKYNFEYGDPNAPVQAGPPKPDWLASDPAASQPQGYMDTAGMQSMPGPIPQAPQPMQSQSEPSDHTSRFMAWKQQQGSGAPAPQGQEDPQRLQSMPGSTSSASQDPMTLYMQSLNNPRIGNEQRKSFLTAGKDMSEIAKNYATASGKGDTYSPDQVRGLVPGQAGEALIQSWGGKPIPKDAVHVAATTSRFDLTHGEKADQFDQREWDKIVKDANPNTARGTNSLGSATLITDKANTALTTLSKPMVTYQEAGNVMADIASMYQRGSPTQFGMQHQEYTTLYGKAQQLVQSVSGNPQDAMPDAIKQRLIKDVTELKALNTKVIKRNLDYMEKAQSKLIKNHAEEWQGIRDSFGENSSFGTQSPVPGAPQPGASPVMAVPDGSMKVINGVRYAKQGGQWFAQ